MWAADVDPKRRKGQFFQTRHQTSFALAYKLNSLKKGFAGSPLFSYFLLATVCALSSMVERASLKRLVVGSNPIGRVSTGSRGFYDVGFAAQRPVPSFPIRRTLCGLQLCVASSSDTSKFPVQTELVLPFGGICVFGCWIFPTIGKERSYPPCCRSPVLPDAPFPSAFAGSI